MNIETIKLPIPTFVYQKIFLSLIFIIRKYFQLLGGVEGREEL